MADGPDARTPSLAGGIGLAAAAILDGALDAVVVADEQGTIGIWNVQATKVFGWTADEALGRNIAELIIPGRYRAQHLAGLAHFRATGEGAILRRRIEITALHRAGHEFPV